MARLTWDQVQGGNFSGANEAARLATNLLSTASAPLLSGIDGYQDALKAKQSAQLMQRVSAAQSPAAIAAGLSSGSIYDGLDPRYLTPGAQEFAAGQAQRLLTEDQTAANIGLTGANTRNVDASTGLTGLRTRQGEFEFGVAQRTDGRSEAKYAAEQKLEPIEQEIARRANAGDITGAQAYAQQHAQLFRDADKSWSTVFSGITTQAGAGRTDYKETDDFRETLRENGIRDDARSIAELAPKKFQTIEDFTKALDYAVSTGDMSAEVAQNALKLATDSNTFGAATPEEGLYLKRGLAAPRPTGDNSWLGSPDAPVERANGGPPLSQREFLARTIMAEAGGEGPNGMLAVGSVIANRAKESGSDLRGVILAPAQFSAWNKETGYAGGEGGIDMNNVRPSESAYAAADKIISGNYQDPTGGATHYYNPSVADPPWGTRAGGQWNKAGNHVFGRAGGYPTNAGSKINPGQPMLPAERALAESAQAAANGQLPPPPSAGSTPPVNPLDTAELALAQTARTAAERATGSAPALSPGKGPVLQSGDPAAAAVVRELSNASGEPVAPPVTAPVIPGPAIVSVSNEQTILDTNATQVPVGTRFSNPRESLLDTQFAKRLADEEQARLAEESAQAAALTAATIETPYGLKVPPPPAVAADPNQSSIGKDILGTNMQQYVTENRDRIASSIRRGDVNGREGSAAANTLGPVFDYLGGNSSNEIASRSALREASNEAYRWWESDAAQKHFERNPEALQEAARDPIAYAETRLAETVEDAVVKSSAEAAQIAETKSGERFVMKPTEEVGPVSPDDLKVDIGLVEDQFTADSAIADMPNVVQTYSALPSDGSTAQIAAILTGKGSEGTETNPAVEAGVLADLDAKTVRNALAEIMDESGINNPAIAAAFLVNGAIKDRDDWLPTWLGGTKQENYIDVESIVEDMKTFAGTTDDAVPTQQNLVGKLQEFRQLGDAMKTLGEVKSEFTEAQTELQSYVNNPLVSPAAKEAAVQQFQQSIFPGIRKKLERVHNTGLATANSDRKAQPAGN